MLKKEQITIYLHSCAQCSSHHTITKPHITNFDSFCGRLQRHFDLSMECDNRAFPIFCPLETVEE
jgi:hypothetical protein